MHLAEKSCKSPKVPQSSQPTTYASWLMGRYCISCYRVATPASADLSGNGFTATTVGAPAITTFPNGDNATQFDGGTQYLEVVSNDRLSVPTTGVLTLEAWMRPDTLQFTSSQGTGYVYWLGKNTPGQSEYSARMYSLINTKIARTVFRDMLLTLVVTAAPAVTFRTRSASASGYTTCLLLTLSVPALYTRQGTRPSTRTAC